MSGFGGYAGALGAGIAQSFDPAYQQAVERAGQIALGKAIQQQQAQSIQALSQQQPPQQQQPPIGWGTGAQGGPPMPPQAQGGGGPAMTFNPAGGASSGPTAGYGGPFQTASAQSPVQQPGPSPYGPFQSAYGGQQPQTLNQPPNTFANRFPARTAMGAPIDTEPDIQASTPNAQGGRAALAATMPRGQPPQYPMAQAPQGAAPPPPPPQQQQSQGQGQGFDQGMGGGPDLNAVAQQIMRSNPGAPPQVIAAAMQQYVKTFNPALMMQLREQQLMQNWMLGNRRLDQTDVKTGINANLKLADINTRRRVAGLPELSMDQAQQGGMIPADNQGGQTQQPSQQAGGELFAGVPPDLIQRANSLGYSNDALLQAATVYQQTGKSPGIGTRAQTQFITGIIRQIAHNINAQQGKTDAEMASGWQKYHAEGKFQDTAATYGARVENAVGELEQLIPQAAAVSNQYDRSNFTSLNKFYNMWRQGQSDPAINDLMVASFGVISAYVRAMNPSGSPRVADRIETEQIGLLSSAVGKEAYMTQLRRMWKEAQASQTATYETGAKGRQPGDINKPMPGDTAQQGAPSGGGKQFHYDAQGNPIE